MKCHMGRESENGPKIVTFNLNGPIMPELWMMTKYEVQIYQKYKVPRGQVENQMVVLLLDPFSNRKNKLRQSFFLLGLSYLLKVFLQKT